MSALVAQRKADQAANYQSEYQSIEFADRKKLASSQARFCITNCALVTQKDKNVRWYLTINVRDEQDNVTVTQTLTFDRSPSRDELFEAIQGDLPQHNCYLELVKIKGGRTFYDLCQDENDHACLCDPHRHKLEVSSTYGKNVAKEDHPF